MKHLKEKKEQAEAEAAMQIPVKKSGFVEDDSNCDEDDVEGENFEVKEKGSGEEESSNYEVD